MDCIKQTSNESTSYKFSKTFSKCIDPKTPSSRFTQPKPRLKTLSEELNISISNIRPESHLRVKSSHRNNNNNNNNNNATKEALIAKLFASISSIKSSYAELQSAQFPYNQKLIQTNDEDIINELKVLTEIKQKYYLKNLHLPPPHVTQLLAEIQEQQSNIKTYEITMKQMEWKIEQKDGEICSFRRKFEDVTEGNKSLEKQVNSSGNLFPLGDNVTLLELNSGHFVRVLGYVIRSMRQFVKHLVSEMVRNNWDIDLATRTIQPDIKIVNSKHKMFVFESYVSQIMFDGFNHHNFYLLDEGSSKQVVNNRQCFFDCFLEIQSLTTTRIFKKYPKCPFVRFCKEKYLKMVHPKMECSIFGNLDQRKAISSGAFPESELFSLFAELARRVWILHCLAFSYDSPAAAFQVKKGCRFSEVYMESVAGENDKVRSGDGFSAAFTVVPGFKIGKMVVQSLVYISPVKI